MPRSSRIFYYLFCITLIFTIFYSYIGFKYIDELLVLFCFVYYLYFSKGKIPKELVWFWIIVIFYIGYSLMLNINPPLAILMDMQQQIKPYLVFYSVFYIAPFFSERYKKNIRKVCIVLAIVSLFTVIAGKIESFWEHPYSLGISMVILSYTYYFFSEKNKNDKIMMLLILTIGLFSGRSKFYGEYILTVYILLFLKNKISFSFQTIVLGICLTGIVIFFTWTKFEFYFIEGIADPENNARTLMYVRGIEILKDYFPFGSGFSTYANHASRVFYSPLYVKYGMNNTWGLSREFSDFVADTYFPQLVQFGIVGIILFILFWKKRISLIYYKYNTTKNIENYKLSILLILIFIIELLASSMFVSNNIVPIMMIFALILNNKPYQIKSYK